MRSTPRDVFLIQAQPLCVHDAPLDTEFHFCVKPQQENA
jgi:hypothetical protein